MASKDKTAGRPAAVGSAEEFAESLKRRSQAAQGLQQDLLTKVPILYGSPGALEPDGDPGIIIARAHREEMLRRHGSDVLDASSRRSDVRLPFERLTTALAVLIYLFLVFGNPD